MSTICIDNTEIEGKGFIKSKAIRTEIEDAQTAVSVDLNKMGTSIPTPYARLFLFVSAFGEINSLEEKEPQIAHDGGNVYHALISEWLDMMEFIFVYGHDTHNLEIIPWNSDDLELLKQSNSKHVRLAKALEDGINNTPSLKGYTCIYIFRYKNIILGGTSPMSIVYTSPNWCRENNEKFYRTGEVGGYLFDGQIVPLHKRGIDFRRFLHKYILLPNQSISDPIRKYINEDRENYDVEINTEFKEAKLVGYANDFYQKYKVLKDTNHASVSIGNLQLFCKIDDNTDSDSQYKIIATSDRYKTEMVHGVPVKIEDIPLVISKQGMDGAVYWKGQDWSPSYYIDAALPATLSTRQLPGFFGTTYPFVTIDDFLEDKIIEVSYDLHLNKFFTGNCGLTHFLLPLKKEIFKFFEPKDLFVVDELTGAVTLTDMFSIKEVDADSDDRKVIAHLNIPTKYGINMEFVREYTKDSIVDCFEFRSAFDLAFFPFYKMTGGGKNIYNIMLGYKGNEKSAEFFSFNDLAKPIKKQENLRSHGAVKTVHIHLEEAFDVVELNVPSSNSKGLIVPIMCEKDVTANQRQYVFCVDFGTTNTHIAYGYSQDGNGNINRDRVKPLDITEDDLQTIYLNNHEKDPNAGFGQFSEFLTPALREFVPCLIGDGLFKLPMRTAVCEIPNLTTAEPSIFGNINIGFNYLNEIGSNKDCIYRTDIKWSASDSDPKAKDRVKMFFKEIMWIMKNKAVMNDGRPDFKLVFTYPQSMRKSLIGKFRGLWNDVREEVGATMSNIKNVNESLNIQALEGVAPYFSFLPELQFGETYVNVDIGGGTSDIIYINPIDGGEKISYSALFAANDIWGDGTNPAVTKQNGFLKGYLNSTRYANLSDDNNIKEHLRAFMEDTASGSSDVISYLFSKEKYSFSDYLDGSDLKVLMLLHLSSIIYYMALAFLRDGVEVPHHITFTGMGSKYIPLIGDASCLNEIITKIFEYRLAPEGIDVKKIDVRFADDPKRVTAAGGVVMSNGSTIDPERNLVYGWENEEYSNKRLKIEDIASRKDELFKEFERFLDMFEDEEFIALVLENTEINTRGLKAKIMQFADNSFKQMQILQNKLAAKGSAVNLEEPMFFWPLKDAIFQLGRQMASPK